MEMNDVEMHDPSFDIEGSDEIITQVSSKIHYFFFYIYIVCQGVSFETIINICPHPPHVKDMEQVQNDKSIFMISASVIIF